MPARFSIWILVLTLGCLPHLTNGAEEASKLRLSLESIKNRAKELSEQFRDTRNQQMDMANTLKESDRAIAALQQEISKLEQNTRQQKKSLVSISAEKIALEVAIKKEFGQLNQVFLQRYLHAQPAELQLLLSGQSPSDAARQFYYLDTLTHTHNQQIQRLRQNLKQVSQYRKQADETLSRVAELQNRMEQKRKKLEIEQENHRQLLLALNQKLQSQQQEISKLKQDEKRLSGLLQKLQQTPATSTPSAKTSPTLESKPETSDKMVATGIFGSLKGKLKMPVAGKITAYYKQPRENGQSSWKGIFISTASNLPIKSIADGQVVFADVLRGFGNLIVVDHGDSYMSIYGNNQNLLKSVGSKVSEGEIIATSGNSSGSQESGLYFELRHRSVPMNPQEWLGR